MVKLMNADQLVRIAAGAGIILEEATPETENLYVYATDDRHAHTVYVGKSASRARSTGEVNVEGQDYKDRIGVGFSALIKENNASRRSFRYDPTSFDPAPLLRHIDEHDWSGPAIESLRERLDARAATPALAVEEVEKVLVRIHVNTGRLIGNSQFASQWEATVNGVPNVVAVLAADIARQNGTLPDDTEVDAGPAVERPRDGAE
ncbi:hypothetical protein ACI2IP_09730 [Microbacterium sp. NPDC090218]